MSCSCGLFPENLGRVRGLLLSNEELLLTKRIRDLGYTVFYDPKIEMHHRVHPDRVSQSWLRRRVFWQVLSDLFIDDHLQPCRGEDDIRRVLDFLMKLAPRHRGPLILARYVALYNLPVEVIIAGNVCEGIAEDYPFARKLGFLDDSAELYRMVDAVVIPLEFSTGIKIKVAESLAWNVPVLATRDAFDGFRAYHSTQHAPTLQKLCEMIVAAACGEIPSHELAWATRKAGIAAAAAQERGFAELQRWIDTSLGPVVRACRELLSCLNQPLQELGPVEVFERAGALSRDDAFRPLAGHCAHQICHTLGHPSGSWGLSQKIFQTNFDLHSQIKWINQQVALNG